MPDSALAARLQAVDQERPYASYVVRQALGEIESADVSYFESLASEALVFFRERMPTREEIMALMPVARCCEKAGTTFHENCYGLRCADAVRALLEEKIDDWGTDHHSDEDR